MSYDSCSSINGEYLMSDEEVLALYDKMFDYFGKLPDPEQEPIQFAHCVKVYRYYNPDPAPVVAEVPAGT